MSDAARQVYEFGPLRIDTGDRLLTRDGQLIPLPPRAVETLLALIGGDGRVMEKDELMEIVWPGIHVEEGGLARNISLLRRVLNDGRENGDYIETIPRRGYRFLAEVKESGLPDPDFLIIKERTRTSFSYEEQTNEANELAAKSDSRLANAIDVTPRASLPAAKASHSIARYW